MRKINMQISRREKSTCNKFDEQKSACNKLHSQNQFHKEENQCNSFRKRKINLEQVPRNKSARNKFHQQNQFHEQKISVQVSQREKSTSDKFHEQKISTQQFPRTKNLHTKSLMNKISFMTRKVNLNVSRREKSPCSKFHDQKLERNKFHERKPAYNRFQEQNELQEEINQLISFTKRKNQHGTDKSIRQKQSEKLTSNKFHEQNRNATSSTGKNQNAPGSRNKINFTGKKSMYEFPEEKSSHSKFHDEINFTRKNENVQVSIRENQQAT